MKSPTAARFSHLISDADVPEHRLRRGDIVALQDVLDALGEPQAG